MPVAVLLAIGAAVASGATTWANLKADQVTTREKAEEALKRVSALEAFPRDLEVVKNDVSWIKRAMEREGRRP